MAPSGSGAVAAAAAATNSSITPYCITTTSSSSSGSRGPLSLPLLEGLMSRPGAADACVKDALKRWRAGNQIASFIRRRRRRNFAITTSTTTTNDGGGSNNNKSIRRQKRKNFRSTHHWLVQGLQSPSQPERRVAFRILAQGCTLDPNTVWQVLELLVQLLHNPVVEEEHQYQGGAGPKSCVTVLTLLEHVVVHVLSNTEKIAFLKNPSLGLDFLCHWMWKSITYCGSGGGEINNNSPWIIIIPNLVGFLHRVVMDSPETHSYLWKHHRRRQQQQQEQQEQLQKPNKKLSPLACLIGSYNLCKTSPVLRAHVMDSTVVLLKQLIDPTFSPPPSSSSPGRIYNNNKSISSSSKKPLRLLETFSNDPSTTTTTTTGTTLAVADDNIIRTSSSSTGGGRRQSSSSTHQASSSSSSSFLLSSSSSGRRRQSRVSSAPSSSALQDDDRSAAAAVARIFSAVYGSDGGVVDEDEDDDIVVGNGEDDDEEMIDNNDDDEEEEEEGFQLNQQQEDIDDGEGNKTKSDGNNNNDHSDEEGSDDSDGGGSDDCGGDDQEEDEEIDSDEGEEDEGEEDEECDDHDLVIHDDAVDVSDLLEFEEMDVDEHHQEHHHLSTDNGNRATSLISQKEIANPRSIKERRQAYVQASMEFLQVQYPPLRHSSQNKAKVPPTVASLSLKAERTLMTSIVNIVKPPKKPLNTKIILRRAPTQEEFFRGSLSKNPVSLNMLKSHQNQNEPTVKDLRQHIANDLQMADSAELLEVLCANKILDVDLKLRVVHQVVWREHVLQQSSSGGSSAERSASALSSFLGGRGSGARSFISSGSGLSMIFGSGLERSIMGGPSGFCISPDTPLSALPPMIVTYRLTGVDGEATEDTVTTLQDPEAPSETASSEELERLMEQQFGITRLVTRGRGVFCLLRSIERNINDTLQKIRRDDVVVVGAPSEVNKKNPKNPSRALFKAASPYPGLELLLCCSKLPSNRKLLLKTRAPTILLRLLLSVLHALEEDGTDGSTSESNSTAKSLQKLIETLASDMVSSTDTMEEDEDAEDVEQDASTLRLLLSAIETSSLSRPLRNVIAKLLPYLTYGQPALSRELASKFVDHVSLDRLGDCESQQEDWEEKSSSILLATFVHASISLPPNPVCDSLRYELIQCGFLERIAKFLLLDIPKEPPCWSPSLWPKSQILSDEQKVQLEGQWKGYIQRSGLKTAFDMLIGLCKQHGPSQRFLGNFETHRGRLSLIKACHWLESTSDGSRISMNGIGLLCETLLDDLAQEDSSIATQVKEIRQKTRNRKKEIAMERRNKALVSMSSFGTLAGSGQKVSERSSVRGTAASLFAPVLGLFGASDPNTSSSPPSKRRKKDKASPGEKVVATKPAWMTEMENMEDEDGLTCAVCQEGRTLQPSELLGLYAYVKKVSIPLNQCGGRNGIDGTDLLISLPKSMPDSLADSHAALEWFPAGKAAGEELHNSSRSTSLSSSVGSNRRATYTTTVSAGNGIHFSCHTKARQADRNHPKAPKSEWEGASLRNSRVNCNVIMPIVSSRSSKVPLVAVDVALTDHQTAISNLLNARPKSMLWNVLHDVRFLLLRMAYGEQLNSDCGGGSLVSNSQLVFYQLLMADMFEKDAEVDAPETSQHARSLSAGFLAACAISKADDYDKRKQTSVNRGIADSSLMAALTCILFHNTKDDCSAASKYSEDVPDPKRRWITGRDYFLRGLINCAGRRHALAVENSGCITTRNIGSKAGRSSSFAEWEMIEDDEMEADTTLEKAPVGRGNNNKAGIDDFRDALRPMIVYFAMMDQLSSDFILHMDDCKIEDCANRLAKVIQNCHSAKNIQELISRANVTLDHDEIMDELQRGMVFCC